MFTLDMGLSRVLSLQYDFFEQKLNFWTMKKILLFALVFSFSQIQLLWSQVPATPVQITGSGGVTPYRSDLNYWTGIWQAPQALYDRNEYQDHPDFWYHDDANEGSTWYNNVSGYGVLIVDLNQLRTINTFKVFQMFSDGKITGIQIFRNSEYTGSTAPNYSSGGWVEVTSGLTTVGTGTNNTTYISNPTSISVSDFQTRYIMIYAYNNGAYSYSSYIELKGIKAFYNNSGTYSINYMRSGPGAPLPIVLHSFTAHCINSSVEVKWETLCEINNDRFILEKSTNMIDWKILTEINGAGNSNSVVTYTYTDTEISSNSSYYRLTQVDYDNRTEVFNPIALNCGNNTDILEVFPNPAQDKIHIISKETEYIVEISTLSGVVVSKGTSESSININTLSPGVFLIRYISDKINIQKTLIISKN